MSCCSDIRNFGGLGDGFTVNTRAIQSAIDARSWAGGGTAQLSAGFARRPHQADKL